MFSSPQPQPVPPQPVQPQPVPPQPVEPRHLQLVSPRHLQPHLLLRPGQPVHVNHRASWLHATVTAVSTRTISVRYQPTTGTDIGIGTGVFADAVRPWAVRPAHGAQLRPARDVAAGDQIIFGNRIRTAAAGPVEGRDGWLALCFTDGGQPALVMPGAVLRLVDDTPQVFVNGRPLAASPTGPAGPSQP
jgi:hypothetical protein